MKNTTDPLVTATLTRNEFGSVRIRFTALRAPGQKMPTGAEERLFSARIYELAAAMERALATLGETWAVSASTWDRKIDIEGGDNDLPATIEKFARRILAECSIPVATEGLAKLNRRAR